MVVCKDIHTIYYRPSLQYYTKQGRFHVPAYCYQCISYGRKLRTTVYNWWQLYICFFPIPFVFTNRNCHTHLYCESAYKSLGKAHSFYDGMMTCSTLMGRFVTKIVWNMNREDALEYQSRSFEMIPADFNGKLLEVPLGTGVLSMPIWKTLPNADITCLDYSENMMVSASQRADEMGIKNISFLQGDVGDLPFEDNTFDVVVSLNGFHAFPDKEAAFRETYRVLKKDLK